MAFRGSGMMRGKKDASALWRPAFLSALILTALVASSYSAAAPLPPPKWMAALYVKEKNSIGLRWMPVPGARGYRILRSETTGSGHSEIAVIDRQQFFDGDIAGGATYYYRIEAMGGTEGSARSEERAVAVPSSREAPIPPPPTWKTVEAFEWRDWDHRKYKISLSWEPIPEAIAYNVYRDQWSDEEMRALSSVTETSYRDDNSEEMKLYRYTVTALGGDFVESPFSEAQYAFTGGGKRWRDLKEVNSLNEAMNRPDPDVRELVRSLHDAYGRNKEGREVLLNGFNSPFPEVQALAIQAAGLFEENMDIREALEKFTKDENPRVRLYALTTLEKVLGTESAATATTLLGDESPLVRSRAARILGRLKIEGAAVSLGEMLDQEQMDVRRAAAWALMKIATPESREILRAHLHDVDPGVRQSAIRALRPSRGTSDTSLLMSAISDPDPTVRRTAVRKMQSASNRNIREMRDALAAALNDPDLEVRLEVVKVLKYSRLWEDQEMLITALSDPAPAVRKEAASALHLRREWRAADTLIDLLRDEDESVVSAAAGALVSIDVAEAEKPLIALLTGSNGERQVIAANALSSLGSQEAIDPLCEALKSRNEALRRTAANALGILGDPRAAEALAPLLEDEEPSVRAAAARALGSVGEPRFAPALIPLLRDGSGGVWTAASDSLGKIGGRREATALVALLAGNGGRRPSQEATALALISPPGLVDLVTPALSHEKRNVRWNALWVLNETGEVDPGALDLFLQGAEDQEWSVREMAVRGLGNFQGERALDALLKALDDSGEGVRLQAVRSLGLMGNSRAVPQLLGYLSRDPQRAGAAVAEALAKITGEDYGPDIEKWRLWLEENPPQEAP